MRTARSLLAITGIALLIMFSRAASGMAGSGSLSEELRDGFSYRINLVGFGVYRNVVESAVNAGNIFILPRYQLEADLRPDFYLDFRRLELIFKPRFETRRLWWEDGILEGSDENDDDVYINEWLARLRLSNVLFVSYGRENLQWGPAYLLSPSNPFNRNNGRNNPELEVAGMDFARLVWIPNDRWTASLIANLDEGEQEVDLDFSRQLAYFMTGDLTEQKLNLLEVLVNVYGSDPAAIQQRFSRKFEKNYALKIDYARDGKFFSFIPSVRESDDPRFGFFAGWNATSALLLYAEASLSTESSGGNDFLAGGAYTLESGANVALEYYRKEEGCSVEPLAACFAPGAMTTAVPGDAFMRKNYALLQYTDTGILNRIDLTLRLIYGFDDQSGQGIGIVQYEMNDYSRLFVIGNLLHGDSDTEYGSFLDSLMMVGVGFTF